MKILVVDDQEMQLYLVGCQLSSAGHSIIGCRSGEEAVGKLNSQIVDMVITDMEMGAMSGEHVRQHVREHFGQLPVILMSGNPDNLRGEGFDGYLEKPFSMRELLVAVENALK
ncbi:MAG: response regulator [Syntrophobacteraceae bacterium]|jgi:CheY-like chemotaxis protein